MFSKSFKVVTHSSSCDFKPPFVGSSIEAPVLSSTGASSTERSTTLRVPVSGSASALRSKNMNGAGGPTCVEHGLRSSEVCWLQRAAEQEYEWCWWTHVRWSWAEILEKQILKTLLSRARLRHNVSILSTLWCGCHLHRTHTTCMET